MAASVIVPMLTGCESESASETGVTLETEIGIDTVETETEYPQPELPVTDYNGAAVLFEGYNRRSLL